MHIVVTLFFFKQKTAYEMRISDWSSDVCSSDLTWPVRTALGSPVDGVTVVLGSHADEVDAALTPFQTPRLKLVRCARWSDGLPAPLTCGLAALPRDCRDALIFLGDMPHLAARLAGRVWDEVPDGEYEREWWGERVGQ